jgi:hypothetical protein
MRGPEARPHNRGLACFVELVTKRWQFDRDILKKTVRTEAHHSHVRDNLNQLQKFIIAGMLRGTFADPKGQIACVVHLEVAHAKFRKRQVNGVYEKPAMAIPVAAFEDLFRAAYPDKFIQKDHGTQDAILNAFVDLFGAEPALCRLRIDGERLWCIMTPPQDECLAMLERRNLLARHDDASQVEDAEDGGVKADVLWGWKALPTFAAHPEAMSEAAEAFMAFLRDPADVWAHAALASNLSALAEHSRPGPNVVALRRMKR